jgi:predicted O-methyltransferase YrrM
VAGSGHTTSLYALLQRAALATPLARWLWLPYRYMFTPDQLGFLGHELEAAPPGAVVEVGCANGDTTAWLNLWMDATKTERRYVAIDTFRGFSDEDIAIEAAQGRDTRGFTKSFRGPTRQRFDHSMRVNGITRVEVVTADAGSLDYSSYAPIAFALVDVDLYRPVRGALERVFPHLADGGLIVVDDCGPGKFEGAGEAYREFCEERGLSPQIEHRKLGLVTRDS